jgi:hypothetical protein
MKVVSPINGAELGAVAVAVDAVRFAAGADFEGRLLFHRAERERCGAAQADAIGAARGLDAVRRDLAARAGAVARLILGRRCVRNRQKKRLQASGESQIHRKFICESRHANRRSLHVTLLGNYYQAKNSTDPAV